MSPQAIARKVAPRALLLAPDNDRLIVCLDREGRAESAAEVAESIRLALDREFAVRGESPEIPLDVVVADRAFEAWLLADINGLRAAKRRRALRHRCYEGWSERGDYGARVLRKALDRYEKTDDGPRYFEMIDLEKARQDCHSGRGWGSASLDHFLEALGA
jgi:hypothetical protein